MTAFQRLSAAQRGILLMILTMFLFSIMDMIAKGLASRHDTFQVVWARYVSQTLFAVVILLPRLRSVVKTRYLRLQLIRSFFLFGATILFFSGIVLSGLASTAAVMSINPLLITLGAFFILGESLGLRRAMGVLAGLLGALIIIRPGLTVFDPTALLGLGAAVFYTGYAISTRFLGREESMWTSFLYTAVFGTIAASLIVPWYWTTPSLPDVGVMMSLGVVGGLGQLALIKALMLAEAGAIAPFAYCGPIFATIWGITFFNEYPDIWVVSGAALIIAAGVYVWHREYRATKTNR